MIWLLYLLVGFIGIMAGLSFVAAIHATKKTPVAFKGQANSRDSKDEDDSTDPAGNGAEDEESDFDKPEHDSDSDQDA